MLTKDYQLKFVELTNKIVTEVHKVKTVKDASLSTDEISSIDGAFSSLREFCFNNFAHEKKLANVCFEVDRIISIFNAGEESKSKTADLIREQMNEVLDYDMDTFMKIAEDLKCVVKELDKPAQMNEANLRRCIEMAKSHTEALEKILNGQSITFV